MSRTSPFFLPQKEVDFINHNSMDKLETPKKTFKMIDCIPGELNLTKKDETLSSMFTNQQLELEKKYQAVSAQSHDHKEGIKAFFEKRKPQYKGL